MTETYLNFEEEQDFKPHSSAKMFKWHPKKKKHQMASCSFFFRAISGGSPPTILDLKVLLQVDPPASRRERITLEMLGEVGEVLKRRTKHYPISPFLQVRTTFLVLHDQVSMSFVMRMRMTVEVESTWSKITAFLAFHKCQRIKRITSTRTASGREVATPMSHGRRTTSHCTKMPSRAQRSCALRHSEKMCSSVSRTPGQWAHHDSSKVLMFLW